MAALRLSMLSSLRSLRHFRCTGLCSRWQFVNERRSLETSSIPTNSHFRASCQHMPVCFYSVSKNHETSSMSHSVVSDILTKTHQPQSTNIHKLKQTVGEPIFQKQIPEIKVDGEESKVTDTPLADSSSGSEKQQKKKKSHTWKIVLVVALLANGAFLYVFAMGTPLPDEDGNPIKDEFSHYPAPLSYFMRTYHETFRQVKITKEPSRHKLLPDPLEFPYMQPKYTLVIEMKDILVHPEWGFNTGWRFKKRPGIGHFMRAVGPPLFELVIFTQLQGFTADPIITKIDPENYVMYRLYRDATLFREGEHIKDLSYLNRDLTKVIMVDFDKRAYSTNTDNGFCLKKWEGDDDTTLGELAEFLQAIATSGVEDVRPVLQYYSQFDDPLAQFRENQQKLKEEQDKQARGLEERQSKLVPKTAGFGGFWRS